MENKNGFLDRQIPALQLVDIKKTYLAGENSVHALKGVSLNFRKSEFVSVLGPSGCGKTTMLNIIGGLDRYTQGDLIIDGRSTKGYNDRDWDTYRNHRIGFIFQTYNLIPHQTVLSNVELALTIGGVSKEERVKRAKIALEKVGLKGQENKRPNQLSGGQCQRVAIARALINEPDILLADEPTGALDSKTSIQIMELIKEISKDKLVIMVTHNGDIAEQYSTRIISLKDGEIVGDTNPYQLDEQEEGQSKTQPELIEIQPNKDKKTKKKEKRSKMSLWTAFKLSLRNLFTKKGRTALVSFAGSIGIIGISLILAVSQGATAYINHVQEATLSSYPITLQESSLDLTTLMESFMSAGDEKPNHPLDGVYKDPLIGELVNALAGANTGENDLASFKSYLESEMQKDGSKLSDAITGIKYSYDLQMDVYTKNVDGKVVKSDTGELMSEMLGKYMAGMMGSGNMGGMTGDSTAQGSNDMLATFMMGSGMWEELLSDVDGATINPLLKEQYNIIDGGRWPTAKDEIVLVVNEKNELNDLTLYALGLINDQDIDAIIDSAVNGKELPEDNKHWSYQDVKDRTYKTIFPFEYYQYDANSGLCFDRRNIPDGLNTLYEDKDTGLELKVVGVIRPNPDSENHMLKGSIGYTYKLTEHIIQSGQNSAVAIAQKSNPNADVFTGKPFKSSTEDLTNAQKSTAFKEYVSSLSVSEKAQVKLSIDSILDDLSVAVKVVELKEQYPNKQAKIAFISGVYATTAGVDATAIAQYLSDLEDQAIDNMLETVLALGVRAEYAKKVVAEYTAQLGLNGENKQTVDQTYADALDTLLASASDQVVAGYYDAVMDFSDSTYEDNLALLGCLDLASPSAINIYASSFENKDVIIAAIDKYNKSVDVTKEIKYTDYMGLLMGAVTTIIDAITYILIAFVAISLVVSSIMIAVITLISVQERTKEIGILRSIGASKRDVSHLFNAETVFIGLMSGLLGVGITYLLCIPINIILQALTGIPTLRAILPIGAAGILVGISVILNLISGIIPSRSAAKKDPVNALRTE